MLERIPELPSGISHAELPHRKVLDPLGFKGNHVSDGAGIPGEVAALRYMPDGEPIPPYTFDHVRVSSVGASPRDLARIGLFHLARTLDQPGLEPGGDPTGSRRGWMQRLPLHPRRPPEPFQVPETGELLGNPAADQAVAPFSPRELRIWRLPRGSTSRRGISPFSPIGSRRSFPTRWP